MHSYPASLGLAYRRNDPVGGAPQTALGIRQDRLGLAQATADPDGGNAESRRGNSDSRETMD
jgi:hypothetical protein